MDVIRSSMRPEDAIAKYAGRVVFIGGGPSVWDMYAHLIQHWDVTKLPYDGPADGGSSRSGSRLRRHCN